MSKSKISKSPILKLKVKKRLTISLLIFIAFFLTLVLFIPLSSQKTQKKNFDTTFSVENSPEIKLLTEKPFGTFKELSDYLRNVAKTKGALYAYNVLRYASLPPQTDLHLLGHTVGDILYQQQGTEGMKYCTDEFRNACSHSIVVGSLLENGENSLPTLSKVCEKAPGGTGAYTMCFHGLGHGILAYTNYNLEKAVELCKRTGTEQHGFREYPECVGGTIMEIVGGGDHDRQTYKKQVGKYIKKEDPLSPCDTDTIPENVKGMCYTYITPNLFTQAGADLGNPNPSYFPKAFSYCAAIQASAQNLSTCYGGLGKEFVVLANKRDIRNIDKMNDTQLLTVYDWCKLAGNKDGIEACVLSALQSLFWGGENDPNASIRFCNLVDKEYKASCFNSLISTARLYINDFSRVQEICNKIPGEYNKQCN